MQDENVGMTKEATPQKVAEATFDAENMAE